MRSRSPMGMMGVLLAMAYGMGGMGLMGPMPTLARREDETPAPDEAGSTPVAAPAGYDPRCSFREQIARAETVLEVGSLLHCAEQARGMSEQTLKKCRREAAVRIEELTKPLPC